MDVRVDESGDDVVTADVAHHRVRRQRVVTSSEQLRDPSVLDHQRHVSL